MEGIRTLDVLTLGRVVGVISESTAPRRIGPVGARLAREPMFTVMPACYNKYTYS